MKIVFLLKRVDCNDGVASYLELLTAGLRARGDRITIISGPVGVSPGTASRQKAIRSTVEDWIVVDDLVSAIPSPATVFRLRAVLRERDFDLLAPQGFAILPLARVLGRLVNRPVIVNYHPSTRTADGPMAQRIKTVSKRLTHLFLMHLFMPEGFLALSTEISRYFQASCHLPGSLVHRRILGVDTDHYRPPVNGEERQARSRLGIPESTLVAVLPGRLCRGKGHDLAVGAIRSLRQLRPALELVCLFPGGGEKREEIEADSLRDAADHAQFRFLGYVERETLRDTYWAADVVLLPSRMEGFGLVVAEAMCCGAIPIRTPSGGALDQIEEGVTGYLVPFDSVACLARAIERVADHPDRPAMQRAVSQFASDRFPSSRMTADTARLFHAIVAAH